MMGLKQAGPWRFGIRRLGIVEGSRENRKSSRIRPAVYENTGDMIMDRLAKSEEV
jgi:hypothetical protein